MADWVVHLTFSDVRVCLSQFLSKAVDFFLIQETVNIPFQSSQELNYPVVFKSSFETLENRKKLKFIDHTKPLMAKTIRL